MDNFSNVPSEPDHAVEKETKEPPKTGKPVKGRAKRVAATPILHFLSTQQFASPFDVNMAVDSGYKVVIPHTNVGLSDVQSLVQDAIFSRPPQHGWRTGVFIGGKDALLALDMLAAAKAAMVPPFELSVFADPGGSFTTAAAMVARVEQLHRLRTGRTLAGTSVAVFGATGVVGFASAVIAAQYGANVKVVSHIGLDALMPAVTAARERFRVELEPVMGARDGDKKEIAARSDIILCAAAAGVRVLETRHLAASKRLSIVADVNAVPPSGIEGIELFDRGRAIAGTRCVGVGPLAIGDVKYKTQAALFRSMVESRRSITLDFTDAFTVARKTVRAIEAAA